MPSTIRILTLDELCLTLETWQRLARRSENMAVGLVLFRLSACCGLRVQELTGLTLDNVRVDCLRPHIAIPSSIAKGRKARKVPLWWDAGTLADLERWKAKRLADSAKRTDPFLCRTRGGAHGKMSRRNAQKRWDTIIRKALGSERADDLSIHCGRHTFCSLSLQSGRTLMEVRDAAGHRSIGTTNIYLHCGQDDGTVGNAFAPRPKLAVA
jgi:integrase